MSIIFSGLIFLITFPILQTLCFLYGVGGDVEGLKLGIVSDETKAVRCSNFDFNGTTENYNFGDCHFYNASCRFLEHLEHPMIHKVLYPTTEEATKAVKHGNLIGFLYIPENFTASFEMRIQDGNNAETWTINYGEIKAYLDMSNRQTGATLRFKLYELFYDFQKSLFIDCGWLQNLGSLPMKNDYMFGKEDEAYTIFMIPGTIITMLFFMGAMMTSQIIITDRKDGIWDRSVVAGVTSLEITLTHFILQACVMVVQSSEVLILIFAVYKYPIEGSPWLIFFIAYLSGMCGMVYGFWVSVICEDHSAANISVSGGFLPMMLLCGLVWPTEAMPIGLRIFAKCLPFTLAIESLRNVLKKGWPLVNFYVMHGIGVLLGWILILGIVSVWLIKLKR